jgi:GNAT superfamily N-acetyltransferase
MILGRYHVVAYERHTDTEGFRADRSARVATSTDLPALAHLLAPGIDHAARLAAGDLCVWAAAGDGRAVGLQWINLYTHHDRHFGHLTMPGGGLAYLNQIVVDEEYRIRGYAPRVMIASIRAAREAGAHTVRGLVASHNVTMHRLVGGLGFTRTLEQRGVRLGSRVTVRRTSRA